jgi:hypothetical protein
MTTAPLDRTITLSFSAKPKYLDQGFGIVTAKLLPTRIIFRVCLCGIFQHLLVLYASVTTGFFGWENEKNENALDYISDKDPRL